MYRVKTLVHCRNVKPATTIENSIKMPQKIKNRITIESSNFTSGCIQKRIESRRNTEESTWQAQIRLALC